MRMTISKKAWLWVIVLLIIPFQVIYADECDDAYQAAEAVHDAARQALKQQEYDRAVELYETAKEDYEAVSAMKGCRCPKIAGASRKNVNSCMEWAEKSRQRAQEQEGLEIFNQAQDRFSQGNDFARSRDWENAVYAFEEAAEIWEGIADTETGNGRKAIKNAEMAHKMAEMASSKYEQ